MISTDDKLITVKKNLSPVVIENVSVVADEKDSEKGKVAIKVYTDNLKLTRIHVFAFNFLPNDVIEPVRTLRANTSTAPFSIISNVQPRNIYLSNRKLGDEYCYVLERKKQTRYVGNNLEKPPVLLKRQLVGETTFQQENLQSGTGFAQKTSYEEEQKMYEDQLYLQSERMMREEAVFDDFCAPAQMQQQQKQMYRQQDMAVNFYQRNASLVPDTSVNSLLSFIQKPSTIYANLKSDAEGILIIN
jgi:hypothetical protein